MSENAVEAPITITLKGGPGFEAPWAVLRAEDVPAAEALCEQVKGSGLLPAVAELGRKFGSVYIDSKQQQPAAAPVAPPAQGETHAPGPPPPPSAPPQGQPTLHPQGTQCKRCGQVLQWQTKIAKSTGKKYSAWICPDGPGGGHDLEFPPR